MKKTVAFVAGAFLAVALAACGSKAKSEPTTPPPATEMAGDAGTATPAPSSQNETQGNPCGGVAQAGAPAGNPCGK